MSVAFFWFDMWRDFQNILRQSYSLSYDNAKVTMDVRLTSNLQNISRRMQEGRLCVDYDSVRKLTYNILKRTLRTK